MSHVTNPNQLAPPVPRKIVPVGKIPGFNKVDGSPAELSARELTAYEWGNTKRPCATRTATRQRTRSTTAA